MERQGNWESARPPRQNRKSPETSETEEATVCAWCGRIKGADGTWAEGVGGLALPQSTHGICPECIASEMSLKP